MKTLHIKQVLVIFAFLGFCAEAFFMAGITALPLKSINIQQTGKPHGGTHEWYVLDKECYTVVQQLETIGLTSSFFNGRTKEVSYFLVDVNDSAGFSYDMIVRAGGKEKDFLSQSESVTLYGMISDFPIGEEEGGDVLPCLNDNGDTVQSRWTKAVIFFGCDVAIGFIAVHILRKNHIVGDVDTDD